MTIKSSFLVRAALLAAAGMVAIVLLVMSALSSIVHQADQQDQKRLQQVATAALASFQQELEKNVRDNAFWNDAAINVYGHPDPNWFKDTWGTYAEGNTYFDTVYVLDEFDRPLAGQHASTDLTSNPDGFFGADVNVLIADVRAKGIDAETVKSAFMQTRSGIAIVAAAVVAPYSDTVVLPSDQPRILIFARHLTEAYAKELGERFLLGNLRFTTRGQNAVGQIEIANVTGQHLTALTWDNEVPGTLSYQSVKGQVYGAIGLVMLIVTVLLAHLGGLMQRLSEREAKARRDATRDALSGLLNRAGLSDSIETLLPQVINARSELALAYIDLDGFKAVNDTFGHAAGDDLIRWFAACLKLLAPDAVHIARLGGDEFACVFSGDGVGRRTENVANSILQALERPVVLPMHSVRIGASIGIAVAGEGCLEAAELVRRADLAMYEAKQSGRGRMVLYTPALDHERDSMLALSEDLRAALHQDRLTVQYQPIFSAKDRQATSIEALVRWHHPVRGTIPPDVFIPIAESSGLIAPLGLMVLRRACEDAARWPTLKLSVNVSPVQLRNTDFPDDVERILTETGTDPARIVLEVTETYLVSNPDRAAIVLQRLRAIGVSIALDDFGSGFSSIGYLRQFKFDRIKIDRSLIEPLETDASAAHVLQATVAMAATLGLGITAEGIEKEEQASIVRLCGCDELQGYLLGRPQKPMDLTFAAADVSKVAA